MEYAAAKARKLESFFNVPQEKYKDVAEADKKALREALTTMQKLFADNRESYLKATSPTVVNEIEYVLTSLWQTEAMHNFKASRSLSKAMQAVAQRDEFMANNVILVNSRLGKCVMWAHNYHVGNAFADDVSTKLAGMHLKEKFASRYQIITFHFGTGSFMAISQGKLGAQKLSSSPPQYSTDHLLYSASASNFFIDIKKLTSPAWQSWRNSLHSLWGVGSVFQSSVNYYELNTLKLDFTDHIIYIRNSNAAEMLSE